jgi:FkbM family methyltransferase
MLKLLRTAYFKTINSHSYSQFGEDKILNEIIKKDHVDGFYVDVGCFHPKKHSNTYILYKRGWSGINIDVEKDKINSFNLVRRKDENILTAVSSNNKKKTVYRYDKFSVNTWTSSTEDLKSDKMFKDSYSIDSMSLNEIIENSKFNGREIDLLNIDIEGNDFDALKSLDIIKYNPKIIIIESHYIEINDIIKSSIYLYLFKNNYSLRSWCFYSLIFVKKNSKCIRNR